MTSWLTLLLSALPLSAAVKNPDTLNYALPSDIDSLDPAWMYDGMSLEVQLHVYEGLLFPKGSSVSELAPFLATAVPSRQNGLISADGLTYTFPIRKNVKFHDGSALTPEDARYSLLRFMLMERAGGPSPLLLEPILGVETAIGTGNKPNLEIYMEARKALAVSGQNLVVKLKKPCAALLSILANYCPIVSKATVIANGGWDGSAEAWSKHYNPAKQGTGLYERANGTGPFKVERWEKDNRQVILARHEGYWRKPARLAHIVFKTVPEISTRKLLLETGGMDIVIMERQNLPQVASLPNVTVIDDLPFLEVHNCFIMTFKINPLANPYIGSGSLDGRGIPPDFFKDLDVRKAMAYAFDYDAYIRDGYRGKGARAHGPIPLAFSGYHNPKQALWPHDPKKAEEHFRKALGGRVWDQGFHFTLTFMEGKSDRQMACQIMKRNLEDLNPRFKVDVRGVQWSTYLDHYNAGKLPMVNARWGLDFPDPHNAVHPFLHSQGNYAKVQGYSNPRADELIARAWREGNKDKRRRLYDQLQAIAHDDLPAIFTIDPYYFMVMRSELKGWYYNPVMMHGYLYPVYKEGS